MKRYGVAVLLVCCLGACAQPSAPPSQQAAPPPEAAPPPPPRVTSEAQIAPGRWVVDQVRCSDLLGAADEDREAAAMFYYGYLAAKAGIRVIDVPGTHSTVLKPGSEPPMAAKLRACLDDIDEESLRPYGDGQVEMV